MPFKLKSMMICAVALAAGSAHAILYTDTLNDVGAPMTTYGNPNVDLKEVEITNTLTSLTVRFATNSPSITAPDWIKLGLILRSPSNSNLAVSPGATNGWNRPIQLFGGSNGWIGGWVDGGGGGEAFSFNGSTWDKNAVTYGGSPTMTRSISGDSVTYTAPLASLGLAVGDTFVFDALTTGGGTPDGAWDFLSMSTPSSPGDPNLSTMSNSTLTYTVVPEPATLAAIGLGIAAMARRRRRKV